LEAITQSAKIPKVGTEKTGENGRIYGNEPRGKILLKSFRNVIL
jgi:hypothetical protein